MNYKEILINVLQIVVISFVAYIFAKHLSVGWEQVKGVSYSPTYQTVIAIILFTSMVPVTGILWAKLLHYMIGRRIANKDAIAVQCQSWLLKYVPGQVGSLINKISWGKKHQIGHQAIIISFIYENIFTVLASALLALIFLYTELSFISAMTFLLFVAIVGAIIVLTRKSIIVLLFNYALNKLGKDGVNRRYILGVMVFIQFTLLFILPRLLMGLGFVFLASSLIDITPGQYLPLMAVYALSGAIGMMAIFVPSGIGVREGMIVLLAGPLIGIETAMVLSIVARFYHTSSDLIVLGILGLIKHIPTTS